MIADRAFDADERVPEALALAAKVTAIRPRADCKNPPSHDRHQIEFFAKLKQYRAFATCYDKTARNFRAAINLAAAVIWLN